MTEDSPSPIDPAVDFAVLLVEADEIARLGLRTWLSDRPEIRWVAEATTPEDARSQLEGNPPQAIVTGELTVALRLCRDLAERHEAEPAEPTTAGDTPVLLWCRPLTPAQLRLARQSGVRGYCAKGTPPEELLASLQAAIAGKPVWQAPQRRTEREGEVWLDRTPDASGSPPAPIPGLQYIELELDRLTEGLRSPNLTLLDRAIARGRQRELRAARWILRQLRSRPRRRPHPPAAETVTSGRSPNWDEGAIVPSPSGAMERPEANDNPPVDLDPRDLQALLFDATADKLQSSLRNQSDIPLEIDLFRGEKKRELLATVLRQFELLLLELRSSRVTGDRLLEQRSRVMEDLWRETTLEFFGRYYTLVFEGRSLELTDILLQDAEVVRAAILERVPFWDELLSHLLFATPLAVDDRICPFGSPEATLRAEYLLHNLAIGVANAVVQPLLDNVADVEVLKREFYDRRFLSTRDIEKFRNDLSWKYRWETYIDEPRAIYESRFWLFVLTERGIRRISVYAPRRRELQQLSGARQAVTLLLEGRDALTPRLRSVVTWVGNGLVYVLTQVLGRGIGLIGRGVLENLGNPRPSRSPGKDR